MSDEEAERASDVAGRLDDLVREVRRQGRAAIAAQAAAESCLEAVLALQAAAPDDEALAGTDHAPGGDRALGDAARRDEAWLRALLPSLDGLDRVLANAVALGARSAAEPRERGFWPFRKAPARDREVESLAEGLRLLRAEVAAALGALGVTIDRGEGAALDAERHRVVEVRPARAGERADAIVEVVRPGYAVGGRLVREADVVATRRDR